jgi:hypothetical protein
MSANAVVECPICMDPIEMNKNCLTTECGHCFHTSCLMTSVAHNGFGCPYCRTKMAEEVADEDSEYDDEEIYEQYDDYALRGLRFFNNNLNGEEHDQEDLDDESEDDESNANEEDSDEDEDEEDTRPPPVSYVAQKLAEQGVTTEDLLKAILCSVNNYERDYEDFERVENEIFGRVSSILNNYTPPV